jgi:hypothetical protein
LTSQFCGAIKTPGGSVYITSVIGFEQAVIVEGAFQLALQPVRLGYLDGGLVQQIRETGAFSHAF